MKLYTVYIIKLANGSYYVGRTDNFERRFREHYKGQQRTTRNFLPVKLITVVNFTNKDLAIKFEKYLKTGSGIAFRNRHLV
ncbi:MAG: GIY-YIG nuclease family protein [Patescibacteria group bacterium]